MELAKSSFDEPVVRIAIGVAVMAIAYIIYVWLIKEQ